MTSISISKLHNNSSNSRCLRVLFLIVAVLTLLVFMSFYRKTTDEGTISSSSSTQGTNTLGTKEIIYKLVKDADGTANSGSGRVLRYAAYTVHGGGKEEEPLSIQGWVKAIKDDSSLKHANNVSEIIRQSKNKAVFFETKGCTSANWETKQFEFALVDAPQLSSFAEFGPDPNAFARNFQSCNDNNGCAFMNLGGDAVLVSPKPLNGIPMVSYTHLAAFVRNAPGNQVDKLWRLAVQEYEKRVTASDQPVWFSTSGMGIAWLHFRLDSRPKYYQYKPFKIEK